MSGRKQVNVKQRILVLAPHPDDEILGAGGTMARAAADGAEIFVAVLTKGYPPHYSEDFDAQTRAQVLDAHEILGVKETTMLSLPTAGVDTVPQQEVNAELDKLFQQFKPDVVYMPFLGDVHCDHQLLAQSTLVASRPFIPTAPSTIYAYETMSETNWNAPYLTPGFIPNVFVDISDYLDVKLRAMTCVKTQLKEFPHERSLEALESLAKLRGASIHRPAAEAFVLVRQIR